MNAFDVCIGLGAGWYLPSREELKVLMTVIPPDIYWTSTEYDDGSAYLSDRNGNIRTAPKSTMGNVAAIRRFLFDGIAEPTIGTVYRSYSNGVGYEYFVSAGTYIYGASGFASRRMIGFTKETRLSGIHLYKGMLFFHDRNVNAPYKVNVERSIEHLWHYNREEDAMVVKAPPLMPEVVSEWRDGGVENFRDTVCQFACRYEYEDGEMSAISAYSSTPFNLRGLDVEDERDFTSVNLIDLRTENGEKKLVRFCSEDGNSFSEERVDLRTNADGGVTSINMDARLVMGCAASRENDTVVGILGGEYRSIGFVLSPKGSFLLNSQFGYYGTGMAISGDGVQVVLVATKNEYVHIYKVDLSGSLPELRLVKTIEGGGYSDIGSYVPATAMMHGAAMGYDGNVCYVLCSGALWRTKSGGSAESDWAQVAVAADVLPGVNLEDSHLHVDFRHVCCSADGEVVYVASRFRVSVSRDGGKSWKMFLFGSDESYIINNICCSSDGKRVMAACNDYVFVSNSYGTDFRKSTGSFESVADGNTFGVFGCGCSDSGDVAFITYGRNNFTEDSSPLFMSRDGGSSFWLKGLRRMGVPCDIFFSAHKGGAEDVSDNTVVNRTTEVTIRYRTGSRHVKNIYLLMKSGANMYRIARISKNGLPDNEVREYVFRNQGSYAQVAQKDAVKLFDNVPLRVRSSKVIQNALMFGGYSDGRNAPELADADVVIRCETGRRGDVSLKCGVVESYGLVYYDAFMRSSSVVVIGDVDSPGLSVDADRPRRVAEVTIRHVAPLWAVRYKVVRKDIGIRFYGINGFDGVFVHKSKIYLDVTGSVDIVPEAGDRIELVSEPARMGLSRTGMELNVLGYDDVTIGGGDGMLPRGRYVVVDSPGVDGYNASDVTAGSSYYLSGYFYLIHRIRTEDDKVYLETPFDFPVSSGMHGGNVKKQTGIQSAVCRLDGDGDVILLEHPTREINRLTGGAVFTTLGRPNGLIENFRETDRLAGLCVSEPYVEDTGYNGLSSFNTGLVNYKDLDDAHGEIELIDGYDTDVDVYQRKRCSRVMYRKNVLTTASGRRDVTQSPDIFGEQQMYAGEWGLSDFGSYVRWGASAYFADHVRGVVVRKDGNGLIAISSVGLRDYLSERLVKGGKLMGCYDPRHESYLLGLSGEVFNFVDMNPVNGWSSVYQIFPDGIVSTEYGVFAMKDGKLYEHDVLESRCCVYGKDLDVRVDFVYNDYGDVQKVFNAILLESTEVPYRAVFRTPAGVSEASVSYFEEEEGFFRTHIPMCGGEAAADFQMAGICRSDYFGNRIPLNYADMTAIHVGDAVYVVERKGSGPGGDKVLVGNVVETGTGYLLIDKQVNVRTGWLIVCADTSQVNGAPHRGRYMEVSLYFRPTGKLLLRSVQVDVDESKI